MVKPYFGASRQFKERVLKSSEVLGRLTIFFHRNEVSGIFDHMFFAEISKNTIEISEKA